MDCDLYFLPAFRRFAAAFAAAKPPMRARRLRSSLEYRANPVFFGALFFVFVAI
jgi:hypothetical protein